MCEKWQRRKRNDSRKNKRKDYYRLYNFANFNGVYGPARGGLIFSVIISERYNLPFLGAPQKDCIVVDDIVDSGDTALSWKDKGYYVATMYYKDRAKVTPDFYYFEKEDKWIVFPWESKE